MDEVWKDIEGYNGDYQVSDLGRIKSVYRLITRNGVHRQRKERIFLPHSKKGYLHVRLIKDGEYKNYRVHRLVMAAFKGESKLTIDHINGVKWDNRLENLRYCTNRQNNVFHQIKSGKNLTGAYKIKNRWSSIISFKRKPIYLGCYKTAEEAHQRYLEESKKLHEIEMREL